MLVSTIYTHLALNKKSLNGLKKCGVHMLEMKLFGKIYFRKSNIILIIPFVVLRASPVTQYLGEIQKKRKG